MDKQLLNHLFDSAQILISKEELIKKAKGETFNVFSLLGMETKENTTHSNFIGNLLNPKGTHLMGKVFLKLFLEEIDSSDHIKLDTTAVVLEYSCGPTNHLTKTGGRIDIYLSDGIGQSISIENKINADDQPNQIQRYVNHNSDRNRVFYLTLFGSEPKTTSKGELKSGEHYFLLSYKEGIINWLNNCIKEAANEPILRESIKQYRILIQKLTKTMDNLNKEELQQLILKNYEAAELITRNFDQAKEMVCTRLRSAVINQIDKLLVETNYFAIPGAKITLSYAQVWILNRTTSKAKVQFGIEPFGTKASDRMFVGTFTYGDSEFEKLESVDRHNQYWSNLERIPPYKGIELRMDNSNLIRQLNESEDFFSGVVEHIAIFFQNYFNENKGLIEEYLNNHDS
ncbi:PD-(D/E)XK nuclease family protein [Fluviicola taffensis]|uniref:Uncharacterized protein n=1 Tax=Fluviicola taffensis (strain DSM 16823 / NCIMB 13979 / RW262) TaxID=755732 RepID=F2IDF4_FLUTR|nr:PD-(D/E)XK nuclease family protein [Fluviicola taffensis]AEA42330.1 hypothetical protein Fluta_0321 [Fluviicola taffensis DSM 16823]